MNRTAWLRLLQILGAVAATSLLTLLFHRLGPAVNSMLIGFCYLLVVVLAARWFGLTAAAVATLAAGLQFDYWLLPPVGTFTIADPRNWVGLLAFLITAVVASGLSAAARHKTQEAEQRRREMAGLYALSRASLLAEPGETVLQIERALVANFELDDVRIETADHVVANTEAFARQWPIRVGQRRLGTLYVQARDLGDELGATLAGIVAIALERARMLRESSQVEILRESEALKSALLDSVTHDLRTPLTSIKAAVTTLRGDDADPAARGDLLAVIEEECDWLNQLVQNLVDMARIEGGVLRPRLRREPLGAIIDDTLAHLGWPAGRVRVSVPADLPAVEADGLLLSQALAQLLTNAAAYGGSEQPIEVRVRESEAGIVTEVLDHGAGLEASEIPRIFEKFYRDPRARRLRPEGLGIGLAIARGIIAAHGGELAAASAPGQGTRVWFTLPRARAAVSAPSIP